MINKEVPVEVYQQPPQAYPVYPTQPMYVSSEQDGNMNMAPSFASVDVYQGQPFSQAPLMGSESNDMVQQSALLVDGTNGQLPQALPVYVSYPPEMSSTQQQESNPQVISIPGYDMNADENGAVNTHKNEVGDTIQMAPLTVSVQSITGEDMKQSLVNFVSSKIFWGKKAAKNMVVSEISTWESYYCVWETYLEDRKTQWKERPYSGGPVDGPERCTPPLPWDIPVQVPDFFTDETKRVQVPHTEAVCCCDKCSGAGRVRCVCCSGSGSKRCSSCGGSGSRRENDKQVTCSRCHGNGKVTCGSCHGRGKVTCRECNGSGRVVKYVLLTVTFTNHIESEVLDLSGLPAEEIQKAKATIISQQTGFRVAPPLDVFDQTIIEACSRLNASANNLINDNTLRLHQERVTVYSVPVAKGIGSYKDKRSEFWVVGNDKVAYAPNYKKDFYHGCCIM